MSDGAFWALKRASQTLSSLFLEDPSLEVYEPLRQRVIQEKLIHRRPR